MYGRELGRAIAHLRGDRTQADCSELADLDPAVWSLLETGRRMPREATLRKVVRGLGRSHLELESTAWRFRRATLEREESAPAPEPRDPTELLERLVTLFEELLFLMAFMR